MSRSSKQNKYKRVGSNGLSVAMKCLAVFSAFAAVGVGGYSLISAFLTTADRNSIDLEYGSVSTPVEEGEVYEEGVYDGVDIFARLNWTFAQQTDWYGEYHGTVNTVVSQDVQTYKYYHDGMLISADITKSSIVNAARQFCYVKDADRVIWREAAVGPDGYNKMETKWSEGAPEEGSNLTISGEHGFKATNGLPAYELSVYVIEPETVKSAEVIDLEGGLHKVTYVMNPDTWEETDENGNTVVKGANAYYINQMIFTGGLPEAPVFESLTVSFTFDDNWYTYKTEVEEAYSAKYGFIAAPCTSTASTVYSYGVNEDYPTAYEDYFYQYMDETADVGPGEKELTVLDCLANAFGVLLAEPTDLSCDLSLDGIPLAGAVSLDLSGADLSNFSIDALKAGIRLGGLGLHIDGGQAYVTYGGAKLKLSLGELVSLFSKPEPAEEGTEEGTGGLDTDALLGALTGGTFTVKEDSAELHSVLPLMGMEIKTDFYFLLDGEKNVSLDHAEVALSLGGHDIAATIAFGGEGVPALSAEEKALYGDAMPTILSLADLIRGGKYGVDLSYDGEGFQVTGSVEIAADPFTLHGELTMALDGGASKKLAFSYDGTSAYVDLDGIRLKANAEEVIDLVKAFTGDLPAANLDLGALAKTLLSPEFAGNFSSLSEESAVRLLIRGTQLLKAFNLDFTLGDVTVDLKPDCVTVSALGISATLRAGNDFAVDTEHYTDVMPFAKQIADLVSGRYLRAQVNYTSEDFSLGGTVNFDIGTLTVSAALNLNYHGSVKSFDVIFGGDALYVTVDGLHVKATVEDAVQLIKEYAGLPDMGEPLDIVSALFGIDFSELVKLQKDEDTTTLTVAGSALLSALGLEFDLGDVTLIADGETLTLRAYGATVEIGAGEPFTVSTEGYAELVKYANTLLSIYNHGTLRAELNLSAGDLAVTGEVNLDFSDFDVQADLALRYLSAEKHFLIGYTAGNLYLSVDGLKVSLNAEEALALIVGSLGAEGDEEARDLVADLLAMDFSELIPELWESNDILHVALSSGALFRMFGMDFDLGDVHINVSEESVLVKLGTAEISVGKGIDFVVDTQDFLDVTDTIKGVISLTQSKYLRIELAYTGEKLQVAGGIDVLLAEQSASGAFTLTYGGTAHEIGIIYLAGDDTVYLSVGENIKVRANLSEAADLLKSLLTRPAAAAEPVALSDGEDLSDEEKSLLEKILSFDLSALLELRDTEDGISILVDCDKIASSLGIGEVTVDLKDAGTIAVTALKGNLTASVARTESAKVGSTDGYIDLLPYVDDLRTLFDQPTVIVGIGYDGTDLKVRADIKADTERRVVTGRFTLVYKGSTRDVMLYYVDGTLYLAMGDYRIKADTTSAVVLLAAYLGFSETEGADYRVLAEALGFDFEGLLALSENAEGDTLTVLIKGTELLRALGVDLDLGDIGVQIGKGYLRIDFKGAQVEVAGSTMPVAVPDDLESYTDLTEYVNVLTGIFQSGVLKIDVAYAKEGKPTVDGTLYLDIKGKRADARVSVLSKEGDTGFSLGLAYRREGGSTVLYLDLDGAKLKLDLDALVALAKGEPAKASEIALLALEESPAALGEEQRSKLLALLDKLLTLNLDDLFTMTEGGDSLSVSVDGGKLFEKLLDLFGISANGGDPGEIVFAVHKGGDAGDNMTLSVMGASFTVTGSSSEEYPALADASSYLDAERYARYLVELFQKDVLRLSVSKLSFLLGEKQVGLSAELDFADGVLGGTAEVRYGDTEIPVSVYYESAEKTVYLGVGDGLKVKASIDDIKALIKNIRDGKASDSAEPATVALIGLYSFGIFSLTETDETLSLLADGSKLLNLLGANFDLGNVTLEVAEGRLGVAVSGGAFELQAEITEGSTAKFDADKESYIDIVRYLDAAVELFRSPAFQIDLSLEKGKVQLSGSVTFDVKNKAAEGEIDFVYNASAKKHLSFVYLDGAMYLNLGEKYRLKADTTSAVVLLAAYLGFSNSEDASYEMLDGILESFTGMLSLRENAEENTLLLLVNGTELLSKLGINFDLGNVAVAVSDGKLSVSADGIRADLVGRKDFTVPDASDFADYTDVTAYVNALTSVFGKNYLEIAVKYGKAGETQAEGTVSLDLKGKRFVGNLAVTSADGTGYRFGFALVKETAGYVLFANLDGARMRLDLEELKAYLNGSDPAAAAIALAEAEEAAPASLGDKLGGILDTLLTLDLDDYFTLAEEDDILTLVVNGTGLLQKILGTATVFGKEINLGDISITVPKNESNIQLTAGTLSLTVSGSDDAFPTFAEGDGAENYADILQPVKYLATLFKKEIFCVNLENLTFTVDGTEISLNGKVDFRTDGTFAGGNLTLTVGETEVAVTLYFERGAEGDVLYLGAGDLKVKASVADIKALITRIKELKDGSAEAHAVRLLAFALSEHDLFGFAEEEGVYILGINGEKLLKLFGSDFDLGNVTLEVAEGRLGVAVSGGAFELQAEITEGSTAKFDADKESYIDIVRYLDAAVELFRSPAFQIDLSLEKGKVQLSGSVTFDVKNKAAEGEIDFVYNASAKKHLSFVYLDGAMYLNLGEKYRLKADTTSAVVLLAAYLGFSNSEDASYEMLDGILESFTGMLSLRENAEENTLLLLVNGTELLSKLGINFDLGNVAVAVSDGKLSVSADGIRADLVGRKDFTVPDASDFADYTDVTAYVNALTSVFGKNYLEIAVKYGKAGETQAEGTVSLDLKGKRFVGNLAVTSADGTGYRFGFALVKETAGYVLFANLDGARMRLDLEELKAYLNGSDPAAAAIALAEAEEAAPASLGDKLGGILDTLLTLDLDDYFTLAEEDDILTLVVNGTGLLQKILGTATVFGKEINLGDISITVPKNESNIQLTAGTLSLTVSGSDDAFPTFAEGDGAENYADILQPVKYLATLFKKEIFCVNLENLTFTVDGTEISLNGKVDFRTDGTFAGGNLTLTVGETEVAVTLYFERGAEGDVLYLGAGDLKVKASVADIKALITRIKELKDGSAEAHAVRLLAFALSEHDLFGFAEEEGVYILGINGEKLLKLFGSDFDLGNVTLEVSDGTLSDGTLSVGVEGGAFTLAAQLVEGTTENFEIDKTDFVDILKYVNTAIDIFTQPTFELDLHYANESKTLSAAANVVIDTKQKAVSGTVTLTLNKEGASANKRATFCYLEGTGYVCLETGEGSTLKFKAKSAATVALLAGYLGFSGSDGNFSEEFKSAFEGMFDDFDRLFTLKESGDVLTLLLDGSQLLKDLGVSVGDIGISIDSNKNGEKLTLALLGAELSVRGSSVSVTAPGDLDSYTDLSEYADTVATLLKSGYLDFALDYTEGEGSDALHAAGTLSVDLKEKQARAEIAITRGEKSVLNLTVVYTKDGMLYVDFGGSKVKANPKDVVDYVKGLIDGTAGISAIALEPMALSDEPQTVALTEEQKKNLTNLLEKLFTLELDDVFTLTAEEDALTVAVRTSELLRKLLGREVKISDIAITVGESKYDESGAVTECGTVTIKMGGATLTASSADSFKDLTEEEKAEYADILEYVKRAADIFASEAKRIDIALTVDAFRLGIVLHTVKDNSFAKGEITLTYNSAFQTLNFVYCKDAEGVGYLYFALDDIRVKAKTEDLLGLVKSLFSSLSGREATDGETAAIAYGVAIIELGSDLDAEKLGLYEEDGALVLAIGGDTIMNLLGDKVKELLGDKFSIGRIALSVFETTFGVEAALSAGGKDVSLSLGISKGAVFGISDEERAAFESYIDIFKYGRMVKKLFTESATLQAEIKAKIGGKDLVVTLRFNKDLSAAEGTLSLGSLRVGITYVLYSHEKDGETVNDVMLYLSYGDDVKLCANVSEAIRLIRAAQPATVALTAEEQTVLERVLALDFGTILSLKESVTESGDELQVTLATAELFEALGINFDLGTVNVVISEGQLVLSVGGKADITVYGTSRPNTVVAPEGYHDITNIVGRLCEILAAQGIEFAGNLDIGDTVVSVEQGVVTWREGGTKFYLRGSLGESQFGLSIANSHVRLRLGAFGIEFDYGDVGDFVTAVKALIERIKGTIEKIKESVTGTFDKDELIASLKGIIDLLEGSEKLTTTMVAAAVEVAAGEPYFEIAPERDAFLTFALGAVQLSVFDETNSERAFLGLGVKFESELVKLNGQFDTAVYPKELDFPVLEGEYYDLKQISAILGSVGAAVDLVAEPDLFFTIGGDVTSENVALYTDSGKKYDVSGTMEYHSGGSFPIHIEMDKNNLWVNTDLFVKFSLQLKAGTTSDASLKDLYIDIAILDYDIDDGSKDGMLDFYVSISQVGDGNDGYEPLLLYAPADEIMTLLSGAASIVGLDGVEIVNEYLIKTWITDGDMVARLKGLGVSLIPTIMDLLKGDETGTASILNVKQDETFGEFTFDIGDSDLVLKTQVDESGVARLTYLGVANAKSKDETTNIEFTIDRSFDSNAFAISGDYFRIEGVDELLLALGRTSTHLATDDEIAGGIASAGEYVRNDLFFIDGKLNLHVGLLNRDVDVTVLGLSVNFDKDNNISLNASLSYTGLHIGASALLGGGNGDIIKGDSVLDITIKNGMMYLRRTQNSYFDGSTEKRFPTPEVVYRAFPLSNFMKDDATMMDNICFMFNFSEEFFAWIMEQATSTDPAPAGTTTDLGTLFKKYIVSCTYAPKDEKNLDYTLILNGPGLVGSNLFSNIEVTLGVIDGVLRSIKIPSFSIVSIITVTADLELRNPEYVFDAGTYDTTTDIAGTLEEAMEAKLSSANWNVTSYLEGQLATVTYQIADVVVGTQYVVFDPATKELYARLNFPSIDRCLEEHPELQADGYTYIWDKYDPNTFYATITYQARPQANSYTLVFIISEEHADTYALSRQQILDAGYVWDEARGAYVRTVHWTFNPDNLIDLPYVTTEVGRIVGFRCPNGNLHNESHRGLDFYDRETVVYTAEWEYINYTVTFDFGNGTSEKKTGHYGDALQYPADTEVPERTGYTFDGWNVTVETFTENVTVSAKWNPNTYHITLVSANPIDGFTPRGDGKYTKVIDYVYGTVETLPVNIRSGGYILNGWSLTEGETETHFTQLPLLAEDREIYAVWDEVGFDIHFVVRAADSATGSETEVAVKNFKYGAALSNLPEVPQKDGYTGVWDIPEGYTVEDEATVYAVYTGITYYITEYSLQHVEGYEKVEAHFDVDGFEGDSYWKKTYAYVFGSAPHPLPLGVSEEVYGYDFDGYYTQAFGEGKRIDKNVIDDDMIRTIFRFNVGHSDVFEEQNVLFARWVDNSVTVYLYSDYEILVSGSVNRDVDGYYKTVTKAENDYDISGEDISLRNRTGLRRLGWWHLDDAGNWSSITDVSAFRNFDNRDKATVKVFALWIEDIKVKVTQFYTNSLIGGAQYNIGGTVSGGLPSGNKSQQIFAAANITPSITGYYVLFNASGSTNDTPGGKQDITVTRDPNTNIGSFMQTSMNSGTFGAFLWTERAKFGGVVMRMEFAHNGDSIVFYGGNVVSAETYTVTYHKESGEVVGSVSDVRTGYLGNYNLGAFSDWGIKASDLAFDNMPYIDELAAENNIPCPQDGSRQGDGEYVWPHRAVTGNTEVYPYLLLDPVSVTFTSDFKFSDAWRASADGTFTYTAKIRPGSTVEVVYSDRTDTLYKVTEEAQQSVTLPSTASLASGGLIGQWSASSAIVGEYGATFVVQYKPNTIIYQSELTFTATVDGETVGFSANEEYSVQYTSAYTLIVPSGGTTTVNGTTYNFLGWYTKNADGSWAKLGDTLAVTASDEPTYAYALWQKTALGIRSLGGSRKTAGWKQYKFTVTVEQIIDEVLVGAFISDSLFTRAVSYRFVVNKNASTPNDNEYSAQQSSTSYSVTLDDTSMFDNVYAHAQAVVEYKNARGDVLLTLTANATHSSW